MSDLIHLTLYITSGTPHSERALHNLRAALAACSEGRFNLQVVDLRKEPLRALQDGIVAVPTLQLSSGTFRARLIGDLSARETLHNFLFSVV